MIRTLRMIAVGAALVAAGCGGSDGGSDTPATPTPSGSLQGGYFAACTFDSGVGNDIREVLIFSGSNVESREWDYPSVNGTCSGLPTLAQIDTGTLVLGATVNVANPSGAGEVAAVQLDVTLSFGSFYTIGWVSPSGVLHVGDDSGVNNGDTPALRPTALQSLARPRYAAPAAFTTLLQGRFESCRNFGGNDEREVFEFNGSAMEVRDYVHPTVNGSCGGDGWLDLAGGGQGTFSLESAMAADFGLAGPTVSATAVVATLGPNTLYQTLWMDTYATVPTLYGGDDGGTLPLAPADRPTVLSTEPRYRAATPTAFPAVVNGTWDACVLELGAPNVDRWERFLISGTSITFSETVYASGNGTCTGAVNGTSGGNSTITLGAATPATLGGFAVTAYKADLFGMYTIVYVDTMASPYTLYIGDEGATAGLDASSDLKRPTVLQEWKPRFQR